MEIIHNLEHFKYKDKKVVICIGNFDGVHFGHKEVINTMLDYAEKHSAVAMAVTFDPHPSTVISNKDQMKVITSIRHKMNLFNEMNVPICFLVKFNKIIADMSAEDFFYKILLQDLNINTIVVGFNFGFGKEKQGDINFLKEQCEKQGINFVSVSPVCINDEIVSSTKIRKYIKQGNFKQADLLLGREYSIIGKVVHSQGIGAQLGYPTANIKITNDCVPEYGVYAVKIKGLDENKVLYGAANLGDVPTFHRKELFLEVYIFDFDEDIYNKEIEIIFVEKIRNEKDFGSKEELIEQIEKDCVKAKQILEKV